MLIENIWLSSTHYVGSLRRYHQIDVSIIKFNDGYSSFFTTMPKLLELPTAISDKTEQKAFYKVA